MLLPRGNSLDKLIGIGRSNKLESSRIYQLAKYIRLVTYTSRLGDPVPPNFFAFV